MSAGNHQSTPDLFTGANGLQRLGRHTDGPDRGKPRKLLTKSSMVVVKRPDTVQRHKPQRLEGCGGNTEKAVVQQKPRKAIL
jgi:hypothetical protein